MLSQHILLNGDAMVKLAVKVKPNKLLFSGLPNIGVVKHNEIGFELITKVTVIMINDCPGLSCAASQWGSTYSGDHRIFITDDFHETK